MQADLELKTLFELEPDTTLDEMLELLRSCYVEPDSGALFTEFCNAAQTERESAHQFVSRLMVMVSKITKMAAEEGCPYDKTMLQKRFFHVVFTGLRDESVLSQLREKCRGDHTIPRTTILKYVTDIWTAEKERQIKLLAQTQKAGVNMVQMEKSDEGGVERKKKVKEGNPFAKIDDLRAEMKAEMRKENAELKAELNEIKNAILSVNQVGQSMNQNPFQNQNFQQQPNSNHQMQNSNLNAGARQFFPRRRGIRKCPNCVTTNQFRCFHCWTCGSSEHKINACPGIDAAAAPAPPGNE